MRRIVTLASLLFFLAASFEVVRHSTTVTEVTVALREGAQEPPPGLGDGAPDYRVRLRAGNSWVDCGVQQDTPIGDGLAFPVPERVRLGAVQELRFDEDDVAQDDALERLPVDGARLEGTSFVFELRRGFDLQAGLGWFFTTPIGLVLAAGLILGIALLVFIEGA